VGKIFYYVGAFLFLFVLTDLTPSGMGRGGLNFILKPVFSPEPGDYWVMISAIILSASISYLVLEGLTKWFLHNVQRLPVKLIYTFALLFVSSLIFYLTGWQGVMVTAITTCIGCIPVFFNCRRSHCMAVLLVPIALNMAGYGDVITQMLGLI
jgi:putative membrane protein